jgi:hypothetical protein
MQVLEPAMNILVNGCSFRRGSTAWPYHLKDVNVVNLACAGAGNDYIFNSTIAELSQRQYDFVVIMWTQPARVDFKVNDIEQFSNSPYTSAYQSTRNDWKEKVVYPINDQDYVEKDWVYGCGFLNRDSALLKTKLFDQVYFYQDDSQFNHMTLVKMIAMQNTLKQLGIPYLFTYFRDFADNLAKIPHLYNMLDQSRIYNDENIDNITKNNDWFDEDGLHPGVDAHRRWAELINPRITKC